MLARSTRGREEAEDVAFGFEPSTVVHGHRVTPVSQARAESSPDLDAEIRKMQHFDPALYAKAMSALDRKGATKPAEENGGGRGKRAGNAHQSPQARTKSGFEYEGSPERVVSQLNKLDRLDLGAWAGNSLPQGDRRAFSQQATTAQSKRQQHLESEFFLPHTRAVRGRAPSSAQAGKTKRTASLMKIEFEPALKDAAEREERKAKMDKIHKGFISDPYILGVHVDILTNATLRAADDIAAELREVPEPPDPHAHTLAHTPARARTNPPPHVMHRWPSPSATWKQHSRIDGCLSKSTSAEKSMSLQAATRQGWETTRCRHVFGSPTKPRRFLAWTCGASFWTRSRRCWVCRWGNSRSHTCRFARSLILFQTYTDARVVAYVCLRI